MSTQAPTTPEQEVRLADLNTLEIIGLNELSQRWGISKQRVSEITNERCPYWRKLDCGRVWLMDDIRKFERTWKRKTGVHVTPRKRREDAYPESN